MLLRQCILSTPKAVFPLFVSFLLSSQTFASPPHTELDTENKSPEETLPSVASEAIASSQQNSVTLENINLSITPPPGWEIKTGEAGLSLILAEPKPEFSSPNKEEVIYQRNITLAVKYESTPIDELRAQEITKELEQRFSQGVATNFRVIDHQFVDYRGTKDGLVLYSAMDIGKNPMMQMHFLVSGQDKQFLMTFTDFEKRFVEDKAMMQAVWGSMTSLNIEGTAPYRYENLIVYGSGTLVFFMLLLLWNTLRKRSFNKSLSASDDYDSSFDSRKSESSTSASYSEIMLPITDVSSLVSDYERNYFEDKKHQNLVTDMPETEHRMPKAEPVSSVHSEVSDDYFEAKSGKKWFSLKKSKPKTHEFAFNEDEAVSFSGDSILSIM